MSNITAQYLIDKYGDQAYHRAMEALASFIIIGGDPAKADDIAKAAHLIGVSLPIFNRWLKGHSSPSYLSLKKLKKIGINFYRDFPKKRNRRLQLVK
jgi:hypothetical protein